MAAAQQIVFFEKSVCDYSNTSVVATASEGDDYAHLPFNRDNLTAWVTSGSTDASLTTYEVDFGDYRYFSEIVLLKHNFKSYTLKYWNGAAYVDFSTPVNETTNTLDVKRHSFTEVFSQKVKLTINGTMTANDDKFLFQFIVTNLLGQFAGWPVIGTPAFVTNRQVTKMLSGKVSVQESLGGFKFDLSVPNWRIQADLDLIDTLYRLREGFLVWLSGGNEDQFFAAREGYRLEDLYLCRLTSDQSPKYAKGFYKSGLDLKLQFQEAVG
jgi:hypothetical protein